MWALASLLVEKEVEGAVGVQEGGGLQSVRPAQPLLSPRSLRSDYHRGVFCYGDTKGNVIVFTSDNVTHGLFNPRILPRTSKWGS